MAQKQERNWVAIITMFFIFGMISFVTNMAAPFGNILSFNDKFEWVGMWGNLMNFTAYLFMGIPAGNMLIKYGYKKTALIALAVGVIGLTTQYASSFANDWTQILIYLCGALICGFCVCMLNTVVNPMLNLLGGGGNTGNQLIQAGGTINSLTGTLTPMLVGALVGTITKQHNPGLQAVTPLVLAGICIFAAAFVIISFIKIVEPQGDLSNVKYEVKPTAFRHCLLGVIAIFFYVGVEIGIPGELNAYVSHMDFQGCAAVGGSLAAIYWLLMLVGRLTSTALSGKVSTRLQMITVSSVAICLLLIAIFLPEGVKIPAMDVNLLATKFSIPANTVPMKCVFIFLCGLCTSIMWGGIFNLSTEGLGKYTAKASGLFMAMVVGGGIMPLIQDNLLVQILGVSYIGSYWLIIAMIAYIFYYSVWGSKNVNKDIKVD